MDTIKDCIMTMLFYLYRVFPIVKNKIVVCSYLGRGYGGEGELIVDKLLESGKDYDIVWLVRNPGEKMPKGVRAVKYLSPESVKEQCTARVWIDNRRKAPYVRKRKGQYYIQVWHGSACIKYVEKDAEDTLKPIYIKGAKNDSKMADLFLASSEWRYNNYKSAFWYDGEIAKGDLYQKYFKEENKPAMNKAVRKALGIGLDKKILLYAPTFRKNQNLDCYNIDYDALLEALQKKFGGEWVIVLRLHPNIANKNTEFTYSDKVINGSLYPQIDDMIIASDILITDYSGCMFAGFKSGKIVMLYTVDLEDYLKNERGLYYNFDEFPAPLSKSNEELINNVLNFDVDEYEKRRKELTAKIGFYSNDGTELIAKRIEKIIG